MAVTADNTAHVTNATSIPEGFEHIVNPQNGYGPGEQVIRTTEGLEVLCGPLINYRGMSKEDAQDFWHGSVLIVTKPGQRQPRLQLKPAAPAVSVTNRTATSGAKSPLYRNGEVVEGLNLYSDSSKAFWRFFLKVPLGQEESRWEYMIPEMLDASGEPRHASRTFVVPSVHDSMRIMFHSCNGFSVGTDEEAWSGPALWNSVLRIHKERPFHIMIGGGDQIYNDNVRVSGPLKAWTDMDNPVKRRRYPFGEELRKKCDDHYFENYVKWYDTEPFATANSQIPQINIWDDHDIIDGFGSYTDHFMQSPVFRGIGGVSFKYYCLFQHHVAPPKSTFTTDAKQTMHAQNGGTAGIDPQQLQDTYVYKETADDPSWIVGSKPGPYVEERSRSLYMRLGKRMAFVGIDARTERTRKTINYPETYDLIFKRLENEVRASNGEIKHFILLLGIPIAYPRLQWLENFFTSPLIGPIRFLNKRFGFGGHLFNSFDGSVDLLDDLDDHYTTKHHKEERRDLMHRLQNFARESSVRVTILGGDVHLGAMGRFYSNPKLNLPIEDDHRYMANVISSAITNKPPPKAIANLLARRNIIHHLDRDTDETLMKIFDKQPGGNMKSAEWNKVTMPSRNYACITEVVANNDSSSSAHHTNSMVAEDNIALDSNVTNGTGSPTANGTAAHEPNTTNGSPKSPSKSLTQTTNGHHKQPKDGHEPLGPGERGAGTTHPAADGISAYPTTEGEMRTIQGGLNISLMVEIDQHDRRGTTQGYGFCVPPLTVSKRS